MLSYNHHALNNIQHNVYELTVNKKLPLEQQTKKKRVDMFNQNKSMIYLLLRQHELTKDKEVIKHCQKTILTQPLDTIFWFNTFVIEMKGEKDFFMREDRDEYDEHDDGKRYYDDIEIEIKCVDKIESSKMLGMKSSDKSMVQMKKDENAEMKDEFPGKVLAYTTLERLDSSPIDLNEKIIKLFHNYLLISFT